MTKKDIAKLKDSVRDENGEILQYRRHKLKYSELTVKEEYTKNEIEEKIVDRIGTITIIDNK